ncbi:hypothetical protein J2S43_002033 [Catenuloplanes nepalensis]|uniref:DoxX family protein n=1 Tax=Catenuloplanes nepalensis TaxID=587533 RepID=A0ABT9MR63_9ACTN|nr:DoxX family protein [Catenuloplanes nepalensis]MDP9793521.1 hypothetical protein [Catenuloplanes nepalensis]
MYIAYVTITVVAALLDATAAVTYLAGHSYPRSQLDMKRMSHRWMPILGALLAAGTLGLLAGFAVPSLGIAAATGLVLYFAGALVAHLRVGSRNLTGWAVFFTTAVATLAVQLAHNL